MTTRFNEEYELVAELGRGTIADTHIACTVKTKQEVIVKLLRRELCEEQQHVDRFLRAAGQAASVVHPNVARVLRFGSNAHGTPFVAMERARGINLEALAFDRRLTATSAVDVALQLLDAVQACHDAAVLHRDIKPRNVIVHCDESTPPRVTVMLTDVGLTEAMSEDEDCVERIGWRGDSLRYMSPERVQGDVVDERADIYSVAAILYELLAGAPLIRETDELRALEAVSSGRWPRLGVIAPQLSEVLIAIVETALSVDRELRPASAASLARMLRPFSNRTLDAALEPQPSRFDTSYFPSGEFQNAPRPRPDSACPSGLLLDPTFPRAPQAPRLESLQADVYRSASRPAVVATALEPSTAGASRLGWVVGASFGLGLLLTMLEAFKG